MGRRVTETQCPGQTRCARRNSGFVISSTQTAQSGPEDPSNHPRSIAPWSRVPRPHPCPRGGSRGHRRRDNQSSHEPGSAPPRTGPPHSFHATTSGPATVDSEAGLRAGPAAAAGGAECRFRPSNPWPGQGARAWNRRGAQVPCCTTRPGADDSARGETSGFPPRIPDRVRTLEPESPSTLHAASGCPFHWPGPADGSACPPARHHGGHIHSAWYAVRNRPAR